MAGAINADARRASPARRRAGAPGISVVLTSGASGAQFARCVDALLPQCHRESAELVVVRRAVRQEVWPRQMPDSVLYAEAPIDASDKALRAIGLAAATGDIVVFVDDTSLPHEYMLESVLKRAPFAHDADGARSSGSRSVSDQRRRTPRP